MKLENKGITLLALVITIVIILLLVGIALQLTFGEHGLIIKANKGARDNSKAELFDIASTEFVSMAVEDTVENSNNLSFENFYNSRAFSNNYKISNGNIIDKRKNFEVISVSEFEDEFRLRFRNSGNESGKPIVNPITTEDIQITGIGISGGNITVQIGNNNYTGVVYNDKTFSIGIPRQSEGVEITVTQKIGSKIESVKTKVNVVKPKLEQLNINKITNITKSIRGTGESGAKVIATISGNTYETTVNSDNTFNLNIPIQEEGKSIVIYQEKIGKISSDAQSITVEKVKIEGDDINDTILKVKVVAGSEADRKVIFGTTESYIGYMVEREASFTESFTETIDANSKNITDWGDGTNIQSYVIDQYYGNEGILTHLYTPRRLYN